MRTISALIFIILLSASAVWSQVTLGDLGNFITTWQTNNPGDSDDQSIRIPMIGNGYDFTVDWGDGSDENYNTNPGDDVEHFLEHTYSSSGTYTVEIIGDFPRIFIDNEGDRQKILTVEQWGEIAWTSMEDAFNGAINLTVPATDRPDLSGVTSLRRMFNNADMFNQDIGHWDLGAVTNIADMFVDADIFNQDISTKTINPGTAQEYVAWDVSAVTDMNSLFDRARAFNQDIGNWDVSRVEDMGFMFADAEAFNQDINGWETDMVQEMNYTFIRAAAFDQNLGSWDITSVTNMQGMFNRSGLSQENYDAALIGWEAQDVQNGVELGADFMTYCNAADARQALIDDHNWTFRLDRLGCEGAAFITTWQTDNPGPSNDDQITIPTEGSGYDFDVYWEDSTDPSSRRVLENNPGDLTLTFPSAGTYRVEITGDFPRIFINNEGDKQKILTVEQWGEIAWTSMEYAFNGAVNLTVPATDRPDLSGVTSLRRMFNNADMFNQDIGHWDLGAVTNIADMFVDADIFNQDISTKTINPGTAQEYVAWDVSAVTDMNSLFDRARAFNQDIGNWDVSRVEDMGFMFADAEAFNQDINGWETDMVQEMNYTFIRAAAFDQNLGSWDITSVTNMQGMFNRSGLSQENYDAALIGWEAQDVQNGVELGADFMTYCNAADARQALIDDHNWSFVGDSQNCSAIAFITTWKTDNPGTSNDQQIRIPTFPGETYNYDVYWEDTTDSSVSGTETGNTGDLTITFPAAGTYRVEVTGLFPRIYFNNQRDLRKIITVEQWGDNPWTSMEASFYGTSNLSVPATDAPDLSGVISMRNMFIASGINEPINHWDVGSVEDMQALFRLADQFNQDLDEWDVSNVTNMRLMFSRTNSFDGDISTWNISNVTDVTEMFDEAKAFNGNLSTKTINAGSADEYTAWDVSQLKDFSNMFRDATAFNGGIENWNVSNVEIFANMFESASGFNRDIGSWDMSSAINTQDMFNRATSFNQDISAKTINPGTSDEYIAWNMGTVQDMASMFAGSIFNQDIGNWNVENVTDMGSMFEEATAFNQDISGWNTGKVTSFDVMFGVAGSFNQDLSAWDVSLVTEMDEIFNETAMSISNYDATLIGWEAQNVQNDIDFGADGLEFCEGADARQALIDDHNWDFSGDSFNCPPPTAANGRVLAANTTPYRFAEADFNLDGIVDAIKIETLPDEGTLQLDGSNVAPDDEISLDDINAEELQWLPPDAYGYNFTSFDFRAVNSEGDPSTDAFTLTIDLGAGFVELTGGEGWRFLASPADGEIIGDFFEPIWTQGFAGSDSPGASFVNVQRLDAVNYQWEPVENTSDDMDVGQAVIAYVYSNDDNSGADEGFPKALTSSTMEWEPLDGTFGGTLFYDDLQDGVDDDNESFFLLGNPHPIGIDYCQTTRDNVADNIDVWDPNFNDGDYRNMSCSAGDVEIAPFQGYWVRVAGDDNTYEIPMAAYMGGTATGYFKQGEPSDRSERSDGFLVSLNVRNQQSGFTNTARILLSERGTMERDLTDAPKLSPAGLARRYLSFYSLDDQNRPYALQDLPQNVFASEDKLRIPLDIQTTESGVFTLDWTLPGEHVFNGSYFLRDNQTGEVIELYEGGDYRFEVEDIAEKRPDRFPFAKGSSSVLMAGDFSGEQPVRSGPRFELLITVTGVDGLTELGAVPEDFTLAQNYPNPFNPTTVINYQLPISSQVRLEVYDMLGRHVATLINEQVAAGRHTINFNGSNLSSGVYLYRLQAGAQIMTKKLTILK